MSFSYIDDTGLPLANIRNELIGSLSNGPGSRYVVWFQGCGHGCVGCYNPGSWSSSSNTLCRPSDIAERILSSGCSGVTFTGGEPMSQPAAFFEILCGLQSRSGILDSRLSSGIILFTGHTLSEIASDYKCSECLSLVDVAIIGRYERSLRSVSGLRGSSNQLIWYNPLSSRGRDIISSDDIESGQVFESHIVDSGVMLTGFPDLDNLNIRGLRRN